MLKINQIKKSIKFYKKINMNNKYIIKLYTISTTNASLLINQDHWINYANTTNVNVYR